MGTLKNISGEPLDVPLLRRTVPDGEEIEVPDSLLTDADLVWPAGVWEVNGDSHEHDPNSPENTAKREEAAQNIAVEGISDGRGLPDPLPDGGPASEATASPIQPATETEGS